METTLEVDSCERSIKEMIRLFTLRTVVGIWSRSIRVSDRLKPTAWKLLTFASLLLFLCYSWLFVTTVLNPAYEPDDGPMSLEAPSQSIVADGLTLGSVKRF